MNGITFSVQPKTEWSQEEKDFFKMLENTPSYVYFNSLKSINEELKSKIK